MNDDIRQKLIAIRGEKISHLNSLQSMKTLGFSAAGKDETVDLDAMISHEKTAIDNLDDAIARLS